MPLLRDSSPTDKQNANTKILTNCHMNKLVNADSIFDKII